MIRVLFLGKTKEKFISSGVEVKSLDMDYKDDFVMVFDINGRLYSSEELASTIKNIENKNITIILGDESGIPELVKKKADLIISLSRMTFTHELARLLIMEQLYRSFTIINNLKYHK